MKKTDEWQRLAETADEAREELQRAVRRIDAMLAYGGVRGNVRELLEDVRAINARHSMRLKLVLHDLSAESSSLEDRKEALQELKPDIRKARRTLTTPTRPM